MLRPNPHPGLTEKQLQASPFDGEVPLLDYDTVFGDEQYVFKPVTPEAAKVRIDLGSSAVGHEMGFPGEHRVSLTFPADVHTIS